MNRNRIGLSPPTHPLSGLRARLGVLIAAGAMAGCVSIPPEMLIASRPDDSTLPPRVEECAPLPAQMPRRNDEAAPTLMPGDTFSLLSWNIYKAQLPGWDSDLRRLAFGKDFVLLQEATSDREFLSTLDGNWWEMVQAFRMNGSSAGVLTAARVTPDYSCGLRVKEPVIQIPKSVLVSRFPIEGATQPLVIANLHGINFTTGLASYRSQFARLREAIAGHTGPLLVVGDFNTWSEAREKVVADFAASLGLTRADLRGQPSRRFFGRAVDHIFYRGLEMLDSGTMPVTSSDHDPLMATFRLAAGNQP